MSTYGIKQWTDRKELSSSSSVLTPVFRVERHSACLCAVSLALLDGAYEAQHQGPENVSPPGSSGDSLEVEWPRAAPSSGELWVRLPDGVMGMAHPGLTLSPTGDAFKLSNYQLACAVPLHIMGKKMSRLASGDLSLTASKGVGF